MLMPSAGTSVEGSTSSVRDQLTVPDTRIKAMRGSKQSPLVAGTPMAVHCCRRDRVYVRRSDAG